MTRLDNMADYFAAEPMRVSAWLRLPLIGLIVLLGSDPNIQMWHNGVYYGVLAAYTLSAVVWVGSRYADRLPIGLLPQPLRQISPPW